MLRRTLRVGPRRLLGATQLATSSGRCQLAQPCSAELERHRSARGAAAVWRAQAQTAQQRQQEPEARMERKPLAPPGYSRTFYKRQLPSPPAIEFASERGRQVFAEALAAGTMNNFFKLIEQFRTQDEPAYCGLASLAMTLNTLSIDPRRTWKGPWRWFHEEMLDCCHPLSKVREEGITLTQAACLARCNGARVELYPHGAVPLPEFRDMVAAACSSAEEHIVVSYSRREFLQTGDGHFSPIGGYNEKQDLVLILDTARFKYPPHWVPLPMLYNAMAHVDPSTGRPRGFMRMGRHPRLDSVLFTLDVRDQHWRAANSYLLEEMRGVVQAAAAAPGATPASVLSAAASAAPAAALRKFVAVRTAGSATHGGVCVQAAAIQTFLLELRGTPLFDAVAAAVPRRDGSADLDAVMPTNCYEPGSAGCGDPADGCCHPANDAGMAASAQQPGCAAEAAPAEAAGAADGQPAADLAATAAASSAPALAASAAQPAVREDLTAERAAMLLLLAPREVWREVGDEALRRGLLALLDTSSHSVVAAEVEYLSAQLWQLPIMQAALEESAASGHTCADARCQHADHSVHSAHSVAPDVVVGGIGGREDEAEREVRQLAELGGG